MGQFLMGLNSYKREKYMYILKHVLEANYLGKNFKIPF